jgi:hypothetical protein
VDRFFIRDFFALCKEIIMFAERDCAGTQAHLDRTGAWRASGRPTCDAEHY